uniref:aggregation-promoting factor C-terminal-like domain-containing protein n=1 Tax=Lactobacillus acidophilus TaxID=1579 RepID=UPI003F570CE7
MADDGTITIGFDVPIEDLVSDVKQMNKILSGVGKDTGKQMESSFKENSEKVKQTVDNTDQHIKNKLGKTTKVKVGADTNEADAKIKDLDEKKKRLSGETKVKVNADTNEANRKIKDFNTRTAHIPKEHNTKLTVTDHISNILGTIRGKSKETESSVGHLGSIIKGTFIGSLASNAVTSVWSHLTGWIGRAVSAGKDYALEQQTMLASWTTLTGSARKGQAMVDMTNKMALAANNSTKMVDQLNQKLYAVTNSAGETGKLTKSILTLQDAFGVDDAAIANFSVQYSQMIGNGKAQAMDLMSIQNVFPKFKQELLEYMQLQTHNHKLTMNQLNDMISNGKITSDIMNNVLIKMGKQYAGATENFSKTIPGMIRTIKSTVPTLLGELTQPFAKAANPIIGTISDWITSKKTNKEFEKLGTTSAEGMNKVVNAFAGEGSDSKKLVNNLNGGLESLNKWLERVFDYIAKHAKDIKQVGKDLWTVATTLGKDVWDDFASIIADIADAIGLTGDNSDKAKTPLKRLEGVLHALATHKGAIKAIANAIVAIAAIKTLNKVLSPLRALANLKVGKGTVLDYLKDTVKNGSIDKFKDMSLPQKAAGIAAGGYAAYDVVNNGYKGVTKNNKNQLAGAIGGGVAGITAFALTGNPYIALASEQGGKKLTEWGADAAQKWVKGWNDYNSKHKPNPIKQPVQYHAYNAHKVLDQILNPKNNEGKGWIPQTPNRYYDFDPKKGFLSNLFVFGANQAASIGHLADPSFYKTHNPRGSLWGNFMHWATNADMSSLLKPFGNRLEPRGDEALKGPRLAIEKWWRGQTDSLAKQLKPITSAKIDWGWLDPQKNGLNKWLAGFTPQVHGKAPSMKNLQLKASGILPKIDLGKWWKDNVESKVSSLKWPKLPKFSLHLPKINIGDWFKDIQKKIGGFKFHWPKIHLPKFKWPKIRLPKLDVKGWLAKIGAHIHKFKFPKLRAPKWPGWNKLKRNVSNAWGDMVRTTKKKAGSLWNSAKGGMESLRKGTDSFLKSIKNGWHSMWNGLAKWFGNIWDSIKKKASGGINGVVDIINGGISGINGLIHDFGGKSNTIGKINHVKLATGTGAFSGPRRPITQRTLALLNDGVDSPETNNQEMIWDRRSGSLSLVPGVNTLQWLEPGQEVFSAKETAALLGATHFAKGTGVGGFLSGIGDWAKGVWNGAVNAGKGLIRWFKEAMNIVSHPSQALDAIFKFKDSGFKGLFTELAPGMFKLAKKGALSWWNELWSMASSKLNGDGGPATGLLKAVEKYGEGHKYVWGASGPTAFDCSGLVMYALKHAYNIDFPHFSGSQYGMTQHISRDQAKMGDLVFWGNHGDEHVGVYAGGNRYFSAQSPAQGIHMNTLDSVVGKGKPLFGRVRGLSQDSKDKVSVKADNQLQRQIKAKVGNGFFRFLAKLGRLFGTPAGQAGMPTGDHTHWMKQAGIPRSDWAGINYIVTHESGWNPRAVNPSSGTYGLGQMQSYNLHYYTKHGSKNNPIAQLMGIMDYIKDRYGSVGKAVAFWQRNHAYRNGGKVFTPEIASIAEDGTEYVINPDKPSFDNLMKDAIHTRAQKYPDGLAAKMDSILNFDDLKYSSANGYRWYSSNSSGKPADGGTQIVKNVTDRDNQVKGNVNMTIQLDSDVIAHKTYPKSKILQAKEIDIAQMGGAIPIV